MWQHIIHIIHVLEQNIRTKCVTITVEPPNTANRGTGEKMALFRKQQCWEFHIITKKSLYFGTLKWAVVLGEGGEWRAVLGVPPDNSTSHSTHTTGVLRNNNKESWILRSYTILPEQSTEVWGKILHRDYRRVNAWTNILWILWGRSCKSWGVGIPACVIRCLW